MFRIRKSEDRGFFNHGWLKSYHTFSFADYYDPQFMGFGPLRVINEDYIEAAAGFPTHGHRDMEIITYPISGALEHKDSMGSSGVIVPYEIQKMTAGSGILHSEFNHLKDGETHLLQIWVVPDKKNIEPSYEQRDYSQSINAGVPTLLVSPTGGDGSLKIHQDLFLWAKKISKNDTWENELKVNRKYWLQIVRGTVAVASQHDQNAEEKIPLVQGDALAIEDEEFLSIKAIADSEVLLFDM